MEDIWVKLYDRDGPLGHKRPASTLLFVFEGDFSIHCHSGVRVPLEFAVHALLDNFPVESPTDKNSCTKSVYKWRKAPESVEVAAGVSAEADAKVPKAE